MKDKLKLLFSSYGELLGIIWDKSPFLVIGTFIAAVISGLLQPLFTWTSVHVLDDGLLVASGSMPFSKYIPYLVIFAVATLLPGLIRIFVYQYVEHNSQLILRTAYRDRMLKKLKTIEYKHMENDQSLEIIDKSFNRIENAARHLFPMYINWSLQSIIASVGYLYIIASVKWWLIFTVLIPFIIEVIIRTKKNYNIYEEIEKYWKRERNYFMLGDYLKSRNHVNEMKLFGANEYLTDLYAARLNKRNKEYEGFYLKHLRKNLFGNNISRIGIIVNVFIYLFLLIADQMSIGMFISLTALTFSGLYMTMGGSSVFFVASGWHIRHFENCRKYFGFSDDKVNDIDTTVTGYDIEFKNVWFRYPGTDIDILKGLSFKINQGEKIALVGKNGEGKTTTIKLLLGLFQPDSGEILLDGKPLANFSYKTRTKIFAPIFQDFVRYSFSLKENVGIGDIHNMDNEEMLRKAMIKGNVEIFSKNLANREDTLLNRDFEGGVDLSGGQWQRVALARAFMGDKPVLLLDEPTSQLDPMAEAELYGEFSRMVEQKTAVFITHRLGSTKITDRILVLDDGIVSETGTHAQLMVEKGLYAKMFNSQKKWYENGESNEQ